MTTETTTPRSIGELLNLGTYQGMTDAEIEMVIEFKIKTEVMRRIGEGDKALTTMVAEQQIADNAESCRLAHEALQSILGRTPVLSSVGGVQ